MESAKKCKADPKNQNGMGTPTIMKKPLVLSSQRWNSILRHLTKDEEAQQQSEQERKYKEYLKEGSREMMKNWKNAIEKSTDDNKMSSSSKKKLQEERILGAERLFKELKENDEKTRQEQIAKARYMIQRTKSGPRELESAAMLCEVLKGREIQTNINAEFNRAIREHNQREDMKMTAQGGPWVEEEQKRIVECQKRNEEYKNELLRTFKDEEKRKAEQAKRQTEVEKKVREQADKELKAQIERERAILQRKKEAMRKNALEAMKMVEQRRLRKFLFF